MSQAQERILVRFSAECRSDERVVAAFLGGSHAAGTADAHSDLDLYLITADGRYDEFFAERHAFVARLGEAVFTQDFSEFGFDMVLFVFADATSGELALAKASRFPHIHGGPFVTLVDKVGLLRKATFPLYHPDAQQQREALRRAMYGF